MPSYTEQLDRLRRSYERFQEIHEGRVHDRQSDHYGDEMYGFFLNCYHLKDWLINDPAFPADAATVEGLINSTVVLQLCADICNAHKHLRLDRPRSVENPTMGSRKFAVGIGSTPTTISVEFMIDTNSGPIEAFDLATQCLAIWERFVASTLVVR